MKNPSIENESLAFVIELQRILTAALRSIGGKTTEAEVNYLLWSAIHINEVAAGYADLRTRRKMRASKMLIRPMMETTVAAIAAVSPPGFFIQKAANEHEEEEKMLLEIRAIYKAHHEPIGAIDQKLADLESQWTVFMENWIRSRPNDPTTLSKINFKQTLAAIGLGEWYAQYRIYSQFTHGAIRAAAGDYDMMTEQPDNLIVAAFTLHLLLALKEYAPVDLPDLNQLRRRINAMIPNIS